MIIENDFANDLLEKIEQEIALYEDKYEIHVNKKRSVAKSVADFDWLIKVQNYSLPIFSTNATAVLQVTKEYYDILVSHWEKDDSKMLRKGKEETIESMMKRDFPGETISMAIYDKISTLVFEYNLVLEATKESNRLFGIEDEKKILLIHLNRYIEILNSDSKQIEFMRGITVNKKISDLIVEIYIRFIEQRLKILNPELPEIKKRKSETLTKLLWKGSQKDLCELFVELQNKGWIEEFKYGERNKIASSICNLFDLSLTKKNERSNPENSFYQILKGVNNRKTKKREYDEILGKEVERKFNKMKKNGS